MSGLVLSLFPGIGLLDMAFEEAGFCVVRGPDLLWGGDVHCFHPPAGRFDGVIGGPPCQAFSRFRYLVPNAGSRHGNMIPEFERCVGESRPSWWLMENVPDAPGPKIAGYLTTSRILNNRWFGEEQQRTRRFSFGSANGSPLALNFATFDSPAYAPAVTSSLRKVPVAIGGSGKVKRTKTADGKRPGPNTGPRAALGDMLRLQGLPEDFFDADCPFTVTAQRKMIGNGVPLAMGRAVAQAVLKAINGPFRVAAPAEPNETTVNAELLHADEHRREALQCVSPRTAVDFT